MIKSTINLLVDIRHKQQLQMPTNEVIKSKESDQQDEKYGFITNTTSQNEYTNQFKKLNQNNIFIGYSKSNKELFVVKQELLKHTKILKSWLLSRSDSHELSIKLNRTIEQIHYGLNNNTLNKIILSQYLDCILQFFGKGMSIEAFAVLELLLESCILLSKHDEGSHYFRPNLTQSIKNMIEHEENINPKLLQLPEHNQVIRNILETYSEPMLLRNYLHSISQDVICKNIKISIKDSFWYYRIDGNIISSDTSTIKGRINLPTQQLSMAGIFEYMPELLKFSHKYHNSGIYLIKHYKPDAYINELNTSQISNTKKHIITNNQITIYFNNKQTLETTRNTLLELEKRLITSLNLSDKLVHKCDYGMDHTISELGLVSYRNENQSEDGKLCLRANISEDSINNFFSMIDSSTILDNKTKRIFNNLYTDPQYKIFKNFGYYFIVNYNKLAKKTDDSFSIITTSSHDICDELIKIANKSGITEPV